MHWNRNIYWRIGTRNFNLLSILIDESRTPLIISGPAEKSSDWYYKINAVIPFLKREEDFPVEEKSHSCTLTDSGVDKVEGRLKLDNLYDADNIEILHHVHQALKVTMAGIASGLRNTG